ncbi:hypothetical protein ACJQWK_04774 [Exserohilum turcicum]
MDGKRAFPTTYSGYLSPGDNKNVDFLYSFFNVFQKHITSFAVSPLDTQLHILDVQSEHAEESWPRTTLHEKYISMMDIRNSDIGICTAYCRPTAMHSLVPALSGTCANPAQSTLASPKWAGRRHTQDASWVAMPAKTTLVTILDPITSPHPALATLLPFDIIFLQSIAAKQSRAVQLANPRVT